MTFSPDGHLLVTGSEGGVLSVLDLGSGEILGAWIVQNGFVNSLAFNRDGTTLIIGGADGDAILVDLERILPDQPIADTDVLIDQLPATAVLLSIKEHTDLLTHVEISPDGTKFLTASWDGTARLWSLASGDLLLTLAGHTGRVSYAAFHPNGQRIATSGADGAVIIWDSESGEQLFLLGTLSEGIFNLAFSRDGKFLAASGTDGSVRVYMMPVERLMSLAHERVTRTMTEEECQRYLHVDKCR